MTPMINYGTVKSAVRPEPMVVDEYSVWMHTDIQETTETGMDGEVINGYQYTMIQYDKDEYIKILSEQNDENNRLMAALLGV